MKTENEIYDVIDATNSSREEHGTQFSGMSYEDGITAALDWVLGRGENPIED